MLALCVQKVTKLVYLGELDLIHMSTDSCSKESVDTDQWQGN